MSHVERSHFRFMASLWVQFLKQVSILACVRADVFPRLVVYNEWHGNFFLFMVRVVVGVHFLKQVYIGRRR